MCVVPPHRNIPAVIVTVFRHSHSHGDGHGDGNGDDIPNKTDSMLNWPARIASSLVLQERSALETQHKNKINLEINRYQAMVQEKEQLSRKWDEEARNTVLYNFSMGGAFTFRCAR